MHVSEDEMEDHFSSDEEINDRSLVPGKRFQCKDLYLRYAHVYMLSELERFDESKLELDGRLI